MMPTGEERDIVEAFERNELRSPRNKAAMMKKHREYAAATFRKDRRVNVRISSRDLDALKKRALSEGIPYQTLIASVLHRYVEGRLRAAETSDRGASPCAADRCSMASIQWLRRTM